MKQESDSQATAAAIEVLRVGNCKVCGKQRVESRSERSAGFGQGLKTVVQYVCATPGCANQGKP